MLQQILNGISVGAIYSLVAVGFSLIFNVMKLVNFAHGGMILIGAYACYAAMSWLHLPPIAALLAATLMAALGSILVERMVLRPMRTRGRNPIYFFVAAIALYMLLQAVAIAGTGAQTFAYPQKLAEGTVTFGELSIAKLDLVVLLVSGLALAVTVVLLYRTKLGLAIRAAAYDSRAAGLLGINMDLVSTIVFGLAGFLAGIGGVFLGVKYAVNPMVGDLVFKAFVAVMLGGLGSLPGAVVGALLLGLVETFVAAYSSIPGLAPAITFSLLILFLLIRPTGIMGRFVEEKV